MDAVISLALRQTTQCLQRTIKSQSKDVRLIMYLLDILSFLKDCDGEVSSPAAWGNKQKLTKVVIFQTHLSVSSDLCIPVGKWLKPAVQGRGLGDLRRQRRAKWTEEAHRECVEVDVVDSDGGTRRTLDPDSCLALFWLPRVHNLKYTWVKIERRYKSVCISLRTPTILRPPFIFSKIIISH